MIELSGRPSTDLTHRTLQLAGMLTRCNAVRVDAVAVPGQVDGGGRLAAPATDYADTCVRLLLLPEDEVVFEQYGHLKELGTTPTKIKAPDANSIRGLIDFN